MLCYLDARKSVLVNVVITIALVIFVLFSVNSTYAAAPTGTMASTALSVKVAETAAINTITITDGSTAQIVSTTDIYIRIPTTIKAYWDNSDTAAVIGGSMGGTATTSATVSYPDTDLRTLKIDVLQDYENSGTVTIGGLSVKGYDSATAVNYLQWSVDGQNATGTASGTATSSITITAGDHTGGEMSQDDPTTEQFSAVTVSFTTVTSTPADGKIQLDFPAGFDTQFVTSATCSTMDGTFAVSVGLSQTTIVRSGGTAQDADQESCTINNVKNPSFTGGSSTFTVTTLTSGDAEIGTQSGIQGLVIEAGRARDITPPGSVTNATITNVGDGTSLDLKWKNPTDADFSFVRVYRRAGDGAHTALTTVKGTSYRDTGLTAGTTYGYLLHPVDTKNNEFDGTFTELVAVPSVTTGTQPSSPADTTPAPADGEPTPSTPAAPKEFPEPVAGLQFGDLIRGESSTAVYYYSNDGKRHPFPNAATYATWYADFSGVKVISDGVLASIPLGSMVRVRPGTKLVKITSDPKVYAIAPSGVLRWIESETLARALFGDDWAKRVIDIDVAFFAGYTTGNSISSPEHPEGVLFRYEGSDTVYYVDRVNGALVRRAVPIASLGLHRFFSENIVTIKGDIGYQMGEELKGKEERLLRVE